MEKYKSILLFVFFIFQLGIFYVFATINALHEDFITNFRSPFIDAFVTFYFFEAACLIIAIFGSIKTRIIIVKIGILTILSSGLIALIGILQPCFYDGIVERVELSQTLRKSFLCPSFSNRSYLELSVHFLHGNIMAVLAYALNLRSKKNIEHLP